MVVLNEGLNFVGGVMQENNDRYDRAQHAEQDESADEARRWIVGEESPLDGYETAHTGPKQTGEKT